MAQDPTDDAATLAFYDREAEVYVARDQAADPAVDRFARRLAPGAAVLELGCGGGRDAEAMIRAGLRVTPTDGSAAMAAQAQARLGVPVRVLRFAELDDVQAFDGVWANASLLHAPAEALPDILARVWRALRPGGLFCASFKAGDGPGRDSLGRYYNFPSAEALERDFRNAAPWSDLVIETGTGGGYDGVQRQWLRVWAVT
jgi:SAM-dependent methyltransferase